MYVYITYNYINMSMYVLYTHIFICGPFIHLGFGSSQVCCGRGGCRAKGNPTTGCSTRVGDNLVHKGRW